MPTYDYNCHTCGSRFEVIQSFSEDSLVLCPAAGSAARPAACTQPGVGKVSKVFSVPSITFKGEGFYRNDSGVSKAPKSEPKPAEESSGTSSDTEVASGGDKVASGTEKASASAGGPVSIGNSGI